jgi:hypothetical protein
MAIELKKIGDIPTLSLGYTHEVSFDASELSASTGSQTTAVQVGGSAMAGLILNAAIIVEELVTASVSTGSAISDATISFGDDGDDDGFVAAVNCFTGDDASEGSIFANTGALIAGAATYGHVVSSVVIDSTGTGNGFGNASKGKFKLLVAYYPTAGEKFSG